MKTEAKQDWIDKAFTQFICYITTTSSWEAQKPFRKAIIDNLPTQERVEVKPAKVEIILFSTPQRWKQKQRKTG